MKEEEPSSSTIVFGTLRLFLWGLAIALVLSVIDLIIHVTSGSSVSLLILPYLASALLLFCVAALFCAVLYSYLIYPQFRKALAFIVAITLIVLIVHLALISDPAITYQYTNANQNISIVPLAQIPLISTCQNSKVNCESCSGCVMDESYYVPAAVAMIDGVHCAPQVQDCNMEHPPLVKALIAVGIAAFGGDGVSLQWGRLLIIILGTACIPLIFAIAWRFSKDKKIAYYSSLFLALDTMFFVHSAISVLDIPVIFFALAAVVTYLYDLHLWKFDKYYVSGALLGLAILSKETAILLVAALATFHLLRGKESGTRRIFSSLTIIIAAILVFVVGLQVYDSLLTGGQVPTFLNQLQYIYSYGSSLVCLPSGFDCPGAFLNVAGNPATAITPLSWLVYYTPTTYFRSVTTVCAGPNCTSFVSTAYYGVTNFVETWMTFLWAPFAAYTFYILWKRRKEPVQLLANKSAEPSFTSAPVVSMDLQDMEKLARLKLLLDSGALTKEEFEAQKNAILNAEQIKTSASPSNPAIVTEEQEPEETRRQRLSEAELAILALIFLCWSYFPYLLIFAEGRVTYPFYILPAVPAMALGTSYFITRPFFPRILIVVLFLGVLAWFVIFFPDQSFLPSWISTHLGT